MAVLLTAKGFAGEESQALRAALALEWIHTYSLIHDDLPLMDDDDLRRGRPTLHRVFGEAQALLAGDALLSDSFGVLVGGEGFELGLPERIFDGGKAVELTSRAIGSLGMVQGQAWDMEWTGQTPSVDKRNILQHIQTKKTGELFGLACALGGLAGGANPKEIQALKTYGLRIGELFQIADDLLDQNPHQGKTPGKDRAQGKLTVFNGDPIDKEELLVANRKVQECLWVEVGQSRACYLTDFFDAYFKA